MDISQQLRSAYETAKAGNRPKARQLVKEALEVEPNNDAAWYLYARIAGDRQKSIYCLEKVLEINPSHERARQDLERFTQSSHENNPRSNAESKTPKEKRSTRLTPWIWIIVAGFASVVGFGCLGYIFLAGALTPGPLPSSAVTVQPLVFSTPTSDCTCSQATGYLDKTFIRIDAISVQIMSIESAYDQGALLQLNFAAFSSEAKTIYKEQLGEFPPPCLQAFQNKTVSLLWNWQQTMEYAATGQYDAADLFIQGFMDDFSALESEGRRLLEEELNGCILDPNSGPNL